MSEQITWRDLVPNTGIDSRSHDDLGRPADDSYLELAIPDILRDEIRAMEESWARIDAGEDDLYWDIHWDMLQSSVNGLEADGDISSELAWYIRRKHLRLEKDW